MKKLAILAASAAAATLTLGASPASATITMVSPSTDNPGNVLCNQGGDVGTTVTCFKGSTAIDFTTLGGTTELRADGGQAEVFGEFNLGTNNPNDTFDLTDILFYAPGGETFGYAEFRLFGGSGVASFSILDNLGNLFDFDNNGAGYSLAEPGRFAFQGIDGQTIKKVTIQGLQGGDFNSLRQVRLGDGPLAIVPEPSTWGMMILGLGLIGGVMRRRQRQTVRYSFG